MATVYCSACNAQFSVDFSLCPRCGIALRGPELSWKRDTVVVSSVNAADEQFSVDVELDSLLLPGQMLDIYQCQKLLGRGGMGIVYLARNTSLQRLCALKILSPKRVEQDDDFIARFQNEGRAAAALVHPNIVTTHAIGQTDDFHFLEMEYVPGGSLQNEIDREGPIGPIRSTSMAAGIAAGLAMAHRLQLVHRDLKPDNVLVTPAGVPKISDFGLAKRIVGEDLPTPSLAGTPYFMAPELFEGQAAAPASDVYALGVCYYLMLTGRLPFQGSSISEVMRAILTQSPLGVRRLNPEIPLDMAECVAQLMQRDPQQRPRDGTIAAQMLRAVLGTTRDLTDLVYEAFQGLPGAVWDEEADGSFRVHLTFRDERSQVVHLENSEHAVGERLLLIYSLCCEARPSFDEEALRLNASLQHGGISIRDIDGKPCFVMVDTYPRGTVTAEDIRRSVFELGSRADSIELRLTGRDVN